jgi:20S proteasome alpha/beta subunit
MNELRQQALDFDPDDYDFSALMEQQEYGADDAADVPKSDTTLVGVAHDDYWGTGGDKQTSWGHGVAFKTTTDKNVQINDYTTFAGTGWVPPIRQAQGALEAKDRDFQRERGRQMFADEAAEYLGAISLHFPMAYFLMGGVGRDRAPKLYNAGMGDADEASDEETLALGSGMTKARGVLEDNLDRADSYDGVAEVLARGLYQAERHGNFSGGGADLLVGEVDGETVRYEIPGEHELETAIDAGTLDEYRVEDA